jgi:phosphoadenosine phosphosulfate reductase
MNPNTVPDINSPPLQASLGAKLAETAALLREIARDFAPAAFATSLSAEDMVLTDLIARHAPAIEVFTLDTGRLPAETYDLLQHLADHYDIRIRIVYPERENLERYVAVHGINSFYESVEARKACCEARKVEPLRRALSGKRAWITGLRRAQAVTRLNLPLREWDAANGLEKFNPLADWSEKEVWAYIRTFGAPYNALHDRGYPSIGCAPCTRAVARGEDVRAGRWWWEDPATKECGLHLNPAFGGVSAQADVSAANVKSRSDGCSQNPLDFKECGLHAARRKLDAA